MRKHNTLKEQLERHPAFLNRKTQNYEEAKLIYKSNISSLKIPWFFFSKTRQAEFKFQWKNNKHSQDISEKEE